MNSTLSLVLVSYTLVDLSFMCEILDGISDHNAVHVNRQSPTPKQRFTYSTSRDFDGADGMTITKALAMTMITFVIQHYV